MFTAEVKLILAIYQLHSLSIRGKHVLQYWTQWTSLNTVPLPLLDETKGDLKIEKTDSNDTMIFKKLIAFVDWGFSAGLRLYLIRLEK